MGNVKQISLGASKSDAICPGKFDYSAEKENAGAPGGGKTPIKRSVLTALETQFISRASSIASSAIAPNRNRDWCVMSEKLAR
ncbi:MAG: hypothetical protein R2684_01030 [Pyrinomonadaceae bacterium]